MAAISQNPENDWPHRLASLALSEMGRDQEALVMARTAVRLAPFTAYCHIILARMLVAGGSNSAEAREAADRAVSLAPHDPASHIAVGSVAAADRRTEDATAAFNRALAIEPDSTVAHNELARLALVGRRFGNANGLAKAAAGFARAVRADPRAGVSRSNLDLVLHLFLTRAATGIFIVAWIAMQVRRSSDSGLGRILPVLLLVFPVVFAARFVSGLAPPLRGFLVRLLRDPYIGGAVVCAGVAATGLVVGAALQQASSVAFVSAAGFALAARLILLRQTRRKFQPPPDPKPYRISTQLLWLVVALLILATLALFLAVMDPTGPDLAVLLAFITTGMAAIALLNVIRRRRRRTPSSG